MKAWCTRTEQYGTIGVFNSLASVAHIGFTTFRGDIKDFQTLRRLTHNEQPLLEGLPLGKFASEVEEDCIPSASQKLNQMLNRSLCLFLFLYIASSLDVCEIYVDGLSGSDDASCGDLLHPCRNIPYNSTNVCLSSGQYNVTDRIPSKMQAWQNVDSDGQEPQIYCLNEVEVSCDVQASLYWHRLHINNCEVSGPDCTNITLKSLHLSHSVLKLSSSSISPNSTISDCLFNNTRLNLFHSSLSEQSVSTNVSSSPSLFRVSGNHMLGSSSLSFSDRATGVRSFQEIINNTCDLNNTLSSVGIKLLAKGVPDLKLVENRFGECDVQFTIFVSGDDATLISIENNWISALTLSKRGSNVQYTDLNIRHNALRYLIIESNGLPLVVQHNDIFICKILETGEEHTRGTHLITDNTFTELFFSSIHTMTTTSGDTNVTRNSISTAEFTFITRAVAKLHITDNVWTGPSLYPGKPALHVLQMTRCSLFIRNSSISGYGGGAINIGGTAFSDIRIDLLTSHSISHCGKGGITTTTEMSHVNLTSITLYNNTSPTAGGAILMSGHNTHVFLSHCNLIENRSPHSSALSLSADSLRMYNVNIIVQDDINDPLVDHSVLFLNGQYHYEGVSLWCTEERPCPTGTYFLGRGAVVEDEERGNKCETCPEKGVECLDGQTPKGKPNYWCGNNTAGQLICHNCPNGYCSQSDHLWNESCIGHRSGDLCGGCADGPQWIILLSSIPFIYVVILLFLPIGDGAVWKSLSYFVQTVPLLLKQERQNSVINIISSLFTAPTNLGSSPLGICVGQMNYILREFISLYIPSGTVALLVFSCLCALICRRVGCTMPRRRILLLTNALSERGMLSRCTTALVTAFLLMYSGLIASYLKLYFCIEIEPSRWIMYNAGTEKCDQPWRIALFCAASILLLPCPLILIFLRRKLKGTETATGGDVLMVLDGCYRDTRKYWESVYMLRRLAIAVAYVFITDERWSATVMRFLLLTALLLHLLFAPFVTLGGQSLETICLVSLCCLTLLNGQLEDRYSHALLFFIVVPFTAGLFIAIHKFWMKRKKKHSVSYEPLLIIEEQ
ncbi:hypothetical protein PROFUN_07829 [Planoprotostelium fungivorum]|uniref:Uncharacterized protein n=1 Tax=Planoprotostelium fungivorum TaxID=1890364 RepID=A0A2P6NL93_9EUKA|nr:hypothetical protein PROFUN_07829 [Planoprotostelium fungivorum]